jgi:lysozyme family protein
MAVSLGISPAIKCVQRACWAVMHKWEALKDDGILGENTLKAIKICGYLIMPPMRAERANHYRNLVEKHPEQKEFLDGWYNRTYNR